MRNSIVKIKVGQRTIQEPKPHLYRDWCVAHDAWVWRCRGQVGATKKEAYDKWHALFVEQESDPTFRHQSSDTY